MDSALTFTETPSVPDDSLKWKYLLSWESWRSFSRCACWSVLCGCDIFLAVGIFVHRKWMELMLCPALSLWLSWLSPFWQSSCTQAVIPSYVPLLNSKEGQILFFPFSLEEITLQMMCCKWNVRSATDQGSAVFGLLWKIHSLTEGGGIWKGGLQDLLFFPPKC